LCFRRRAGTLPRVNFGRGLTRAQLLVRSAAAAVAGAGLPAYLAPRARAATSLGRSRFEPLVGQIFRIGPTSLRLTAVEDLPDASGSERAFSLVFHGAHRNDLRQGTYTLAKTGAGRFEMFLVPVGRARSGQDYQAIFDRRHA
jgi:hypothetical protein